MGRRVTGIAVALLSAALVTEAYLVDAAATVVDLDEFAVVRNGTTIFDDSFNRNTTLSGGSGTLGNDLLRRHRGELLRPGLDPRNHGQQRPGTAQRRERYSQSAAPATNPAHPDS
jgi:hypothetical protein